MCSSSQQHYKTLRAAQGLEAGAKRLRHPHAVNITAFGPSHADVWSSCTRRKRLLEPRFLLRVPNHRESYTRPKLQWVLRRSCRARTCAAPAVIPPGHVDSLVIEPHGGARRPRPTARHKSPRSLGLWSLVRNANHPMCDRRPSHGFQPEPFSAILPQDFYECLLLSSQKAPIACFAV